MKVDKKQLLQRVRQFIEMPGVCAPAKRAGILEQCKILSHEQLYQIIVTLRIRTRTLLAIARSSKKLHEIKETREHLNNFLNKYGIQS